MNDINEDLRKWFKEKWVRFDTKGNIKGDCAKEEGEGKPKCLPMAKAHALGKEKRASAARRKRRKDPHAERKGKAKFVKTHNEEVLLEKNAPTNPKLWAQAKAQAKKKFKIYPSAYANGWAAKWYKSKGGGWKSLNEDYEHEMARNEIRTAMRGIQRLMKHLEGEGELEAWVQSKLTKASDYIDTIADYMDSRDETVKEAYELIEEAKKKMDKRTIPQTVQMLTPGSNPYADDSTAPSYISTPGQAITEAKGPKTPLGFKRTIQRTVGELKGKKRKVAKEIAKEAQKEIDAKKSKKSTKETQVSNMKKEEPIRAPRLPPAPLPRVAPVSPPKQTYTAPKIKGAKPELNDFGGVGAFGKYVKETPVDKFDPEFAKNLISHEYNQTVIHPDHSSEAEDRLSKNKEMLKRIERVGHGKNPLTWRQRARKILGLKEEGGAGDMGTTELTNTYVKHTPGQLPLDDTTKVKKKLSDTIKNVVKEEILNEATPRIGVGQTSRRTIRFQEKRKGSPPGRKVSTKRPTAKHNVATRGPAPIRKPRPGATVAGGIRNTAKFVKAATKNRRQSQVSMRNRQNARRSLTMSSRG